MTNRHDERVRNLVQTFRDGLPAAVRSQVSPSQLDELAGMIRTALSDELRYAADVVEQAAQKLRAEAESRNMGL